MWNKKERRREAAPKEIPELNAQADYLTLALLHDFAERLAQENPDPAQLALVKGSKAKISEAAAKKRVAEELCVGLHPSKGVLDWCPKRPTPNMNPARGAPRREYSHTYCTPQCYGFTKRRREQGLGLGAIYVKGRHYSPRPCRGWTVLNGSRQPCGELYTPPLATSAHARCAVFKQQSQKMGFALGSNYVRHKKVRVNTQYLPKPCTWWVVRDHLIAECRVEFTPKRATDKYCPKHSAASQNQELDLRTYPHLKVGVSILRTCAYRKCGKTFDRAKRSISGEYYCPRTSHGTLEKLARKEDRWAATVEAANQANKEDRTKLQKILAGGKEKHTIPLRDRQYFAIGRRVEDARPTFARVYARLPARKDRTRERLKAEGFVLLPQQVDAILTAKSELVAVRQFIAAVTDLEYGTVAKHHCRYLKELQPSLPLLSREAS